MLCGSRVLEYLVGAQKILAEWHFGFFHDLSHINSNSRYTELHKENIILETSLNDNSQHKDLGLRNSIYGR